MKLKVKLFLNVTVNLKIDYIITFNYKMNDSNQCPKNKCISCNVVLDYYRDGTEEEGFRCHNCYWEEEGPYMRKKDVPDLIYPDYRPKKNKK